MREWETDAHRIVKEGGGGGAATLVIFGLKNLSEGEWKEVARQEQTGPGGGPIQSVGITTSDPIEAAKVYQRLIGGK